MNTDPSREDECDRATSDPRFAAGTIVRNTVVRRLATADDVDALFRLWKSRRSLAEFVNNIEFLPGLYEDSKALIREAFTRTA